MNLDDELRRMFADVEDRLDVPVRSDASDTIVAGAQRLRRRRIATATVGGVVAAVAMVGSVVLFAPEPRSAPPAITSPAPTQPSSVDGPSSSSSAPGSSSSTSPPPGTVPTGGDQGGGPGPGNGGDPGGEEPPADPPPPAVVGAQVGPDGFGPLRLGMTYDELVATGVVTPGEPPVDPDCSAYEFTVDGVRGYVHVTAAGAQAILPADAPLHTADGVSTEWTLAQVQEVYPQVTEEAITASNPVAVQVPGNPSAVYMIAFIGGDVVTAITIQWAEQPCV